MRIVINHLTRMHGGHMCLAGVDVETQRHVRPVLAGGALPYELLARYGGPFDMGRIVQLGAMRPQPDPPHIEDHVFVAAWAKVERVATPAEFWGLLDGLCEASLQAVFGSELRCVGPARYGTSAGQGRASLGCLRPRGRPTIYSTAARDGKPQVRMRLSDGQFDVDASVTDLRLFGADHSTPDRAVVQAVARRIVESEDVILTVGLTRRFQPSPQSQPVHYLQVNNIHFKEEPVWQMG
jgi:hypothetical protein